MKFDFSKIKKEDIQKLLYEKELNIAAANALFEFSFYSAKNNFDYHNYQDSLIDFLEVDLSNKDDAYFYESRIKPSIKEIKDIDYLNNYYRQNINPKPYKAKKYELTYLKYKPYQAFPYDDILIHENYIEVSQMGYFTSSFPYLAVLKDDVVWMSTDPNEINTMQEAINESYGHVLAFGLGLGYFPIMCAVKDEVKDVTIIEKDEEIIDIFKKHILPLFAHKEKIHIIKDDAFNYARKDLNKYDYLFIDIWHNPEDGLPLYLKFKNILKDKKIKTSYWLEKSILAMYRRCLLTVIEESLLGYKDNNYLKVENEYDRIINDLYFKTKSLTINSYEQLIKILNDNSLLNLV